MSQNIEYKAIEDAFWTLHANVGPSVDSASVTGVLDNVIYQFRVTNICQYGFTTPSSIFETVHITCPTVSLTPGAVSVDYSFSHLGGNISSYTVELLNSSDVAVAGNDFLSPSGTISGTFSGLTPVTGYKVRVTVFAAGVYVASFSEVCTPVPFTTDAVVCDAPTSVNAVMGA